MRHAFVVSSSSLVFAAQGDKGRKKRRLVFGNWLSSAANAVTAGDIQDAVDQLNDLLTKLDGKPDPEDWMLPGTTEGTTVANRIRRDVVLLGHL